MSLPAVVDFGPPGGEYVKFSDCCWPRAVVQWSCVEQWDRVGLGSLFLRG